MRLNAEQAEEQLTPQQNVAWYLTLILIILVACMPGLLCSLYYLSTVPDVTWQRGSRELTYDRVWMARSRGPLGLGYESRRVTQIFADDRVCTTTVVRYFLWRQPRAETIQNIIYDQVFSLTEQGWQPTGTACN